MTERERSIKSNLKKAEAHQIEPHEYDEAPEWTKKDFAAAEIREGDKVIRRGRPPLDSPKRLVSLRLDRDLVEHFRKKGPGWQTRINTALRKAARLKAKKRT